MQPAMDRGAAEVTAREMARQGHGYRAIHKAIGGAISERVIRDICREEKGAAASSLPLAPVTLPPRRYHYEEAAEALKDWIGKRTDAFAGRLAPRMEEQSVRKYAIFSDVHLPFHNPEALAQAIEKALAMGCTGLILAGDTFDLYRLSSYAKTKRIQLQEEIAKAVATFEWLCSHFKKVFIFWGNHEMGRYRRNFLGLIPEEWRFMVKDLGEVFGLDAIPNLERVGHTTPWGKEMVWLYQLGSDAVITHCEKSATAQGQNVEKLNDWLREWGRVLGLPDRPRFVTAGHTHRLTRLDRYDAILVETGMLADWSAQEYQLEPDIHSRRPGVWGFAVITQVDGRTVLDESGIVRVNP